MSPHGCRWHKQCLMSRRHDGKRRHATGGSSGRFTPSTAGTSIRIPSQTAAFSTLGRVWHGVAGVGLIGERYEVYDGTSETNNCSDVNHVQWSYNNGVFLHGAAHMWNYVRIPTPIASQAVLVTNKARQTAPRHGAIESRASSTRNRYSSPTTNPPPMSCMNRLVKLATAAQPISHPSKHT